MELVSGTYEWGTENHRRATYRTTLWCTSLHEITIVILKFLANSRRGSLTASLSVCTFSLPE